MGLDFYGIYTKKNITRAQIDAMDYKEFESRILFYGRKSWELVYALNCDTSNDCMTKLNLDDWVNLVESLSAVAPFFDEIREAYQTYNKYIDEYDTTAAFAKDYPRAMQLVSTYEKWYDETFETTPYNGYQFTISYLENCWNAADSVVAYLEDPDYDVWMIASY